MQYLSTKISLSAGLAILVAFFMPWITVSCTGMSVEITGYEMATGVNDDDLTSSSTDDVDDAHEYLLLVPLIGLGVLFIALRRGRSIASDLAGAGMIGLAIMGYEYIQWQSDMADIEEELGRGLVTLTYEIGWWITILAFLAVLAAAWSAREEMNAEQRQTSMHYGQSAQRPP